MGSEEIWTYIGATLGICLLVFLVIPSMFFRPQQGGSRLGTMNSIFKEPCIILFLLAIGIFFTVSGNL
jgi:hypothetical protein